MLPRAGQNRGIWREADTAVSVFFLLSVHLSSLFSYHCEFRIDKNEHFKTVCISSPAPDLSAGL